MAYDFDDFREEIVGPGDWAASLAADSTVASAIDQTVQEALRWFAEESFRVAVANGRRFDEPQRQLIIRYSKSQTPQAKLYSLRDGRYLALLSIGLVDALIGVAHVVEVLAKEVAQKHVNGTTFPISPKRITMLGAAGYRDSLRAHVQDAYARGLTSTTRRALGAGAAHALLVILFHEFAHFLYDHSEAAKGADEPTRKAIEGHADLLAWHLFLRYVDVAEAPPNSLDMPPTLTWSAVVEAAKYCHQVPEGGKRILIARSVWVALAASGDSTSPHHLSAPSRWRAFCNSRFGRHIDVLSLVASAFVGNVATSTLLTLLGLDEEVLESTTHADESYRALIPDLRRAALRHVQLGLEKTIFGAIIPGKHTFFDPDSLGGSHE